MQQKQIPFFIIILLIIAIFSFYIGKTIGVQQVTAKYEEKIKTVFPEPNEIKSITGTIKAIDNNLTLEANLPVFNPFKADIKAREYIFSINDQTKIIKRTPKSSAEIEKMVKDQNFSPFNEIIIKLGDLKVGDMVEVIAKDNLKQITKSIAEQIIYTNMSELAPVR